MNIRGIYIIYIYISLEERIFENSKHAEQSIEDKLSRIKKELDEVERRIQVAEKEVYIYI